MTLFDVAKKNIKGNLKNYIVYLISMLFSVVIYYTFVSLQYSTEIQKNIENSKGMQSIFIVASIILILFVTIFIFYSNAFFARKRKKEVGLYSLMGVRKKTIGRMLFYENLLMGIVVLTIGIVIGTFLSKLFSMILLKLLGTVVDAGMTFSLEAILNTFVVFTVIILITSIQGYRLIYRFKLIELFQAEKTAEKAPKPSVIKAIASIVLLSVGYYFAKSSFNDTSDMFRNLGFLTIGIIGGTFLLFRSLIVYILRMLQKNKSYYYKGMNLIDTSQLVYRMQSNSRTLSVIALLSAMALLSISVGYSMYYSNDKAVNSSSPFSYMYLSQGKDIDKQIKEIIQNDSEHPIKAELDVEVIKAKGETTDINLLPLRYSEADKNPIKIISASTYNEITKSLDLDESIELSGNDIAAVKPMYTDNTYEEYKNESITLKLPDGDETFYYKTMLNERVLNWSFPDVVIVVSDNKFEEISDQITPLPLKAYKVLDDKTTKETSDKLTELIPKEALLPTYYTVYRDGIENGSLNIFIFGFLGLVFLAATGSILYFKQLSEANMDMGRYTILRKVGVKKKEIFASIAKQTFFIFALPLILGIIHSVVVLDSLSNVFSNMIDMNLTVPIVSSIVAYIIIYIIYYLLTVSSINKSINNYINIKG